MSGEWRQHTFATHLRTSESERGLSSNGASEGSIYCMQKQVCANPVELGQPAFVNTNINISRMRRQPTFNYACTWHLVEGTHVRQGRSQTNCYSRTKFHPFYIYMYQVHVHEANFPDGRHGGRDLLQAHAPLQKCRRKNAIWRKTLSQSWQGPIPRPIPGLTLQGLKKVKTRKNIRNIDQFVVVHTPQRFAKNLCSGMLR